MWKLFENLIFFKDKIGLIRFVVFFKELFYFFVFRCGRDFGILIVFEVFIVGIYF